MNTSKLQKFSRALNGLARLLQYSVIFSAVFFTLASAASAQSWNLPTDLNSGTMQISFQLDTTWHTVHGKVKELEGKVFLSNLKDKNSIRASLSIPVKALDTDNEDRDDEMRESMDATIFPKIVVEMPEIRPSCSEQQLTKASDCKYNSEGTITIRQITLPLVLNGDVSRSDNGSITVTGRAEFDWSKFGIKDPSILVAKVSEHVQISFVITLPKKG